MKKIIYFLLISLCFSQCGVHRPTEVLNIPSVKLNDYTFETTPNDLDNVGYVFAVDESKTQIPITTLSLSPKEGNIVVETNSSTKDITFGALLKFLGIKNFNIPANADYNNNTKVTTTFKLENPRIARAYLITLDSVLSKNKDAIRNVMKNQNLDASQLYVILEVIKSNKMTYDFSKSKLGNADLNAVFSTIGSVNDSLKWNNSGKKSLNYDLKTPLNVFYKLYKLNVLGGINGNGDIIRGNLVKEDELVYMSKKPGVN